MFLVRIQIIKCFIFLWFVYFFKLGKTQIRVLVAEELSDQLKASAVTYKHLDFECESDIAEDIKRTFSQIIMFCDSAYARHFDESNLATSTKWSRRLFKMNEKYNKYFWKKNIFIWDSCVNLAKNCFWLSRIACKIRYYIFY